RRYDPMLAELTSRLSSADIPKILDHLAVPFAPRVAGQRRPLDVLLATNMIAVGVDISRLGLMVVANQPKSTAEYIQATSRVGRRAPGLVLTVFNWARPRDLSHYETFEHFHATVYRRVEALSVTPFADRALDRGLTGVLVALVRHLRDEYNGNVRAQDFDRYSALADHVVRYLSRRARQVAADNDTERDVQRGLDARLDWWATERRLPGRILAYDRQAGNVNVGALLSRPEAGPWTQASCPTSLRDVEPGIRLLLIPNSGRVEVDEPGYAAPPALPAGIPGGGR
ncbi:MAG TPA: helicase-related protein, partial [Mycobacteriales bacterium]